MSALAWLACSLLALATLYGAWFLRAGEGIAALVFALPPLVLALATKWWPRGARFWSGVLALAWFSHGVVVAWSRPGERGYAVAAIALALLVVYAANAPALRARLGRGKKAGR